MHVAAEEPSEDALVKHWRIITAVCVLGAAAFLVTGGIPSASTDSAPTMAQLKAKVRQQANRIAELKDEVDAQDAVISDQNDANLRLRTRIANWPDPLDVITARGPDGLWAAMVAIWQVFPTLDPGALCGYDKGDVPGGDVGLSLTSYTFYLWSGC